MFNVEGFKRTFDFYYTGWDFMFLILLLIAIFAYGLLIRQRNIKEHPYYKFYPLGLMVKVFGGVLFCLVYTGFYSGGDTTLYYWSAKALINLAQHDFDSYFRILLGDRSAEALSAFNSMTEFPFYTRDPKAFAVVRFTSIFVFLGGKSYLWSTIFLNAFLFGGFWKFYKVLCSIYPHLMKTLAYGLFLIPSVIFWGSGILKDSYTMAATLWFAASFYNIVIKFDRKRFLGNAFYLVFSVFLLISLKPYILMTLILGMTIWFAFGYVQKIKSSFIRLFVFPVIVVVAALAGTVAMTRFSSAAGEFYSSPEAMMERAAVVQNDLTQDYYGGNSFNIGGFDASYAGIISKAPIAIISGFFRPFPWEARSPFNMLSALENTFVFALLIFSIFGRGIKNFGKQLTGNHYVVFALTFSISLSYIVGLTTANFGALVRYKIPYMPFIFTALLIIYNNFRKERKIEREIEKTEEVTVEQPQT